MWGKKSRFYGYILIVPYHPVFLEYSYNTIIEMGDHYTLLEPKIVLLRFCGSDSPFINSFKNNASKELGKQQCTILIRLD